jgi:hypothetical protein
LLLGQVGAADIADGYLFAQGGEEVQHFRGDGLVVLLVGIVGFGGEGYEAGWCECAIDVEEADCVLDGALIERRVI